MKTSFLLCILLILCTIGVMAQQDLGTRTFILLRHAEKENSVSSDPALTEQGKERARALATMLRDQPIASIYSTTYRRTQGTAGPLAELKKLNVQYYEPVQASGLLKQLMLGPDKGAIVVVGHSNTIPDLVNTLLGREAVSSISEEDYGLVFIVTLPVSGESGSLVTLRLPDPRQSIPK